MAARLPNDLLSIVRLLWDEDEFPGFVFTENVEAVLLVTINPKKSFKKLNLFLAS